MRLEQLEYLVTVADTKSMTIAEKLLYTSHQNISKSIANLEKELDITLLTRTSKGVSLTEQGKEIANYAKQMLMIQDKIYDVAKKNANNVIEKTEQINILLAKGFSKKFSIVQPLFEKMSPNVLLFAQESEPYSILQDLLTNKLEQFHAIFALIETEQIKLCREQLSKQYDIFSFAQSQIVFIAAKIMELNPHKVYTMSEINALPFSFYQDAINQTNFFFEILKNRGFSKTNCYFPGSPQICSTFLKNGKAAQFVLDSLIEYYYEDLCPFDTFFFTPSILVDNLILLRKDAPASAHAFVEYFLHVYQS